MEFQKLDTTFRKTSGKGPSRRMRLDGLAPAVIYGKGLETISITLSPKALKDALAGPLRTNTPLNLQIKGGGKNTPKEVLVMVRDHQYHPVTRDLLHVDFLGITKGVTIDVEVPIRLLGRSEGEQLGGIRMHLYRTITLSCIPSAIPAELTIDITELQINESKAVKDLVLPEGATCALDGDISIVTIATPKAVEEETPEDEEGVEGEEGAEGEEGDKKPEEGEKKPEEGEKKDKKD